jgi:hypothetical protein
MIFVNQLQLDQVKYIIEQSVKGNHLLFHATVIKRIASRADAVEKGRTEAAEQVLEQMILCDTISKKKMFLEALDPTMYDDVVRVYMNIVQNSAHDSQGLH